MQHGLRLTLRRSTAVGSRPFARTFAKKAPVPFHYEPVFQDAVEDDTQYRCLTTDYVSTIEVDGKTVLKVDPEGLRLLSKTAMNDISHLLRPAHLKQLASILDDPEASANDRFVALELLKAVWCAGPGPQNLEFRVAPQACFKDCSRPSGIACSKCYDAISMCVHKHESSLQYRFNRPLCSIWQGGCSIVCCGGSCGSSGFAGLPWILKQCAQLSYSENLDHVMWLRMQLVLHPGSGLYSKNRISVDRHTRFDLMISGNISGILLVSIC